MRKLIILLSIVAVCLPSYGATRYVAQTAGTFSGGTACNGQTAISAATFNATTNSPGDLDYGCGTITGTAGGNVLTVLGSGASGNPVTLKFDTGASLSSPYCNTWPNQSGCLVISTEASLQSYIVVDGGTPCGWTPTGGSEGACNGTIVNTDSGTGLTTNTSTNGIEAEDCTGCEIKNIGIYNLYVQSSGDTNANPQYENCISYSGSNVKVHDSKFHDVGWCLNYQPDNGDSGMQTYNNEVYNTPHPMFIGERQGSGYTASNVYIYGNYFHDYANWDTTSCTYHVEGIHASGPGAAPFPTLTSVYTYNNQLGGGSTGACLFAELYWSPNTGTAGSAALINNSWAFNNILVVNGNATGEDVSISGNGNELANNTIVNLSSTAPQGAGLTWANISQNTGYTFKAYNNAVSGFLNLNNSDDNTTTNISLDYQAYANASGGNCYTFVSGLTCNWTTYQANGVEDQHAVAALGTSTPNCCQGTIGISTTTWVPQSGSIVIGAGENLTSICSGQSNPGLGALCSDAAGVARPTTGAWDIGAYQYASAPTTTGAPPSLLLAFADQQ